ncbi:breast cancer anti-estrogen resistance protein 1-like isoform X2 [Stegodyphus dumicola]|uniref:breast cancer anti-estrogen resistance protein 1-like isoform X2 n=1 Tax=Stegodyphus dumicola TaxID=202533 RepID=UPI0015ACF707|nr:breast cancer anti-estrogen resistance protein 1-like isoform X2 [Stegodyphus dumicola]
MLGQTNACNCLAKALYDNVAEAPDELAFRKGDILTVLEQNTNSLEGWWLCSLRGRQGIVPGNRLRLLPGMYDPTGLGNAGTNCITDASHAMRRSWASNPNKVVTPQKIGAVYLYDIPSGAKLSERNEQSKSSSPVSRYPMQGCVTGSYDTPPSSKPVRVEAYDEPRSHPCRSPVPALSVYDSPKSNAPVTTNGQLVHDYDIPNSDQISTYDVPRSAEKDIGNSISHIITIADNYDVPASAYKNSPPTYDGRAFSRSSGDTSGSSSFRSPSGSHSSIETLSLSSVGGSNRSSLEQHPGDLYDIPPEPQPINDARLAHQLRTAGTNVPYQSSLAQETYDIPTNNMPTQFYDTPTKPVKAQIVADGVYDVPPQAMRDSSPVPRTDIVDSLSQISLASSDLPDGKNADVLPECSELLLDREAAVELLMKYQHEVQSSISKLFSFVSTTWRKYESMDAKLSEIKTTCHKLQSSLIELYNFAQGALANSTHAADKSLCFKLNKLVMPIKESCATVKKCVQALDEKGWIAAKLAHSDDSYAPDELDMLVACARNLVEDVRQVASLIQGNSTLLFKNQTSLAEKSKPPVAPKPILKVKPSPSAKPAAKLQERPLPPTPANLLKTQISSGEYFNEYDYVNLESKETVEKENESIKAVLPKDMCQSFDELVKQSEIPVVSHSENVPEIVTPEKTVSPLDQKDVQLLMFYGVQIETHIMHLTNAIDAFLMTIKNNQPPKVFVGHSKFIVIGAHKLVYIGDSVHRNLNNPELKTRIMHNSNSLCDSLKTLVNNTKKAATEFPSVIAVQEMVDSVVDVSHLANDLKMSIIQASKS